MDGREKDNIEQSELDYINAKRTYDEYQDLGLNVARDIHGLTMQVMQNGITAGNLANNNALGSADLIMKQAIAHRDIAIDRQWNVDEVAQLVAKTAVSLDAIAAAVAAKVTDALKEKS